MFFGRKPKPAASPSPDAPPSIPPGQPGGSERRRAARFETTVLTCPLGEVADVSRTGMRVRGGGACPVKPGQIVCVDVCSPTDNVELSAKVARVRGTAYGRYEIGLVFENVSDACAAALENMARFGTRRAAASTADRAEQLRRLSAAMRLPDHYATLGLKPGASAETVQTAYRALARQYHPDLNKDPEAERRFCAINEANDVLTDPERRAEYDALSGHARAA